MNVPKLRFPEFRGMGEWRLDEIGRVIDLLSGYPFDGIDISENSTGNKLLRGINITEGVIRHSKDIDRYYLASTQGLEKYKVEIDDLVIAMDGSKVGKNVALITQKDKGALLVQRVARLRAKDSTPIQFIFQQINSSYFQSYVDKINTSSGIPHISAKQIKEFKVCFPKISEQRKIAACLSSLDELMTAETQTLEAYKQHKKGLMQQLFPQTGETTPRVRFAEFLGAGEWEESKLSGLIDTITPPQKLSTASYKMDGEYPIIDQSQSYICGWTNNQDALITDDLPLIIFGDHTCILKIVKMPFAQGADGIKILKAKGQIDALFLYQYLKFSPVVMEEYKRHFSILKEKLILFPKIDTSEQQKIANCLSSLDELINAQTRKIDVLKTHKKGLMQGLFPNPSEEVQP